MSFLSIKRTHYRLVDPVEEVLAIEIAPYPPLMLPTCVYPIRI